MTMTYIRIGWLQSFLKSNMSTNLALSPKLAILIVQYAIFCKALTSPTNSEEGDRGVPDISSRIYAAMISIWAAATIVVPISYIYFLACHPAEVLANTWTPGEILSVVATISGGLVRFWCFNEMGRHFTFQLMVRNDHKLIQTGPYKLVRHPSYTAIILSAIGFNFFVYAYGWDRCIGYLAPSYSIAWRESWGRVVKAIVVLFLIKVYQLLSDRAKTEDKMMRTQFGQEWENYATRSWRFIPYVL